MQGKFLLVLISCGGIYFSNYDEKFVPTFQKKFCPLRAVPKKYAPIESLWKNTWKFPEFCPSQALKL